MDPAEPTHRDRAARATARGRGVMLLGGVSGTGKSTIADALALRLGITRVLSTDLVRASLRSVLERGLHPEIHAESFDVPWAQAADPDVPQVADAVEAAEQAAGLEEGDLSIINMVGFQRQAAQVVTALSAIVSHCMAERWPSIVEGVHLHPGVLAALGRERGEPGGEGDELAHVLLVVRDEQQHRENFRARESVSTRAAAHYLRNFPRIRTLQEQFLQLAAAEGTPVVDSSDPDVVDQLVALAPRGLRRGAR